VTRRCNLKGGPDFFPRGLWRQAREARDKLRGGLYLLPSLPGVLVHCEIGATSGRHVLVGRLDQDQLVPEYLVTCSMTAFIHRVYAGRVTLVCFDSDKKVTPVALVQKSVTYFNPPTDLDLDSLKSPSWILRPIDNQTVEELARSIANMGLLQPIVVRRRELEYEVVFGNHRVEACRRVGMKRIPAFIRDFNEDEVFLARISENLVRNSFVNPIEEARGYRMLIKNGWTINTVGRKIGKGDSYVCERLAMLDRLGRDLFAKAYTKKGHLTPSPFELLSRVGDTGRQKELAELVEKRRLSVRALEDILNGVPLPTKVTIEDNCGALFVRIPTEYAATMEVTAGQTVRMYARGRKLVLENTTHSKAHRKRRIRLPVAIPLRR